MFNDPRKISAYIFIIKALILFRILARCYRHRPEASAGTTKVTGDQRFEGSKVPEEANRQWEREAGERRDKFGRLTFYLTAATSIAAVAAVFVAWLAFRQTYRQAEIAQRSLIATGRAWVSVASTFNVGSINWDKTNGGFLLSAPLTVENKGNSPALDLTVFLVPVSLTSPKNVAKLGAKTKEKCSLGLPTGAILFQGSPIPAGGKKNVSRDEVEAYTTHLHNLANSIEKVPDLFLFDILACANYKIVGDTSVHTTGIHYTIENSSGGLLHIGEDAQLKLTGDLLGNYAD